MSAIPSRSYKETAAEIINSVGQTLGKHSYLSGDDIVVILRAISDKYELIAGQWFIPKDANISAQEREAITSMNVKHKIGNVRFLPTDKNMGVCVVGKEWILQETHRQLTTSKHYV